MSEYGPKGHVPVRAVHEIKDAVNIDRVFLDQSKDTVLCLFKRIGVDQLTGRLRRSEDVKVLWATGRIADGVKRGLSQGAELGDDHPQVLLRMRDDMARHLAEAKGRKLQCDVVSHWTSHNVCIRPVELKIIKH